ncbi:MAG: glycosyltransferase family 4 protein [Lachnospiraceae bacterium]|nr:glycosyltransferase family 4 protein [Lachnospiraceae bacterium]
MNQKKKLLVTASTFPRWEGDTEPRFILDYAKAMMDYYDVTVLAPAAPGAIEEEVIEGVHVVRFHYFPIHKWETLCYPGAIVPRLKEKKIRLFLVPFFMISLKRFLTKFSLQFDLVHAHWLIPQGIVQAKIKGIPYLVTGHGGDVTSLNNVFCKSIKAKCMGCAIVTVGVSSYICDKMKEINPGINPKMISMGCDLSKFSPEKRDDNYFSHEKKNILFVGRLAEKKGVTYLIDAMNEIDAMLYIVGEGPLEKDLKEQAGRHNKKIVFVGSKSHDELPIIYASSDLFVAPSIVAKNGDQEGLPVSIMEAMASGVPVICGLSGGTKDIVNDGINGFILDVKDVKLLVQRINQIIGDDVMAASMKECALKTVKDYSYKKIAEKYIQLIREAQEQ